MTPQLAAYNQGFAKGNAPGPYDPPPVLATDPLSADARRGYDVGRKHHHATAYPANPQGHTYPLTNRGLVLKQIRKPPGKEEA